MTDRHRPGATCVGQQCDICEQKECSERITTVDTVKVCPMCYFTLYQEPTPVLAHYG